MKICMVSWVAMYLITTLWGARHFFAVSFGRQAGERFQG